MHVPGMLPEVQFFPKYLNIFLPKYLLEQKTIWYFITRLFSYQSFTLLMLEKLNQKVEIINLDCDSKFLEKLYLYPFVLTKSSTIVLHP